MIRPATDGDLAVLADLETVLFGPDAWNQAALGAELVAPGRRFVVADEGEVVGFAVSMSIGDVVDLQRIAVSPARQRGGVATALLDDLLAHPGAADRMMLEVSAGNDAALAFYLRRGFARISTRPRYYRDGTDAVVLSRDLASGRMEP